MVGLRTGSSLKVEVNAMTKFVPKKLHNFGLIREWSTSSCLKARPLSQLQLLHHVGRSTVAGSNPSGGASVQAEVSSPGLWWGRIGVG